jgi:hypothetical protein
LLRFSPANVQPGVVADLRPLDLDDVGAKVPENLRREGTRDTHGHVHDAHALQ